MILVVSSVIDEHSSAVLRELDRMDAASYLLDLSRFPQNTRLSMRFDSKTSPEFVLHSLEDRPLRFAEVAVVWWRRPQPFDLHPSIGHPAHRTFAYNESHNAFAGLWQVVDAFWVNHPSHDEVAALKGYQLSIAREVGLEIPVTLISTDPDSVRAFVDQRGPQNTVYKSFSATEQVWRETRVLRPDEVEKLENVVYAPVIFQEYIPASVDLRVTIVGDEVFPAAIHSQETTYPIDFRMDMWRAHIESTQLPDQVEQQLRELMRRLGLVYGAVDMRRTPDGRHVFLEVNPAGQWLFIEERTDQPISSTLACLLAERDQRR
jgi:glutathione synthase/RimK-type ligase-like ATP-grasp enzyme